jgi:hypothetical protein
MVPLRDLPATGRAGSESRGSFGAEFGVTVPLLCRVWFCTSGTGTAVMVPVRERPTRTGAATGAEAMTVPLRTLPVASRG